MYFVCINISLGLKKLREREAVRMSKCMKHTVGLDVLIDEVLYWMGSRNVCSVILDGLS